MQLNEPITYKGALVGVLGLLVGLLVFANSVVTRAEAAAATTTNGVESRIDRRFDRFEQKVDQRFDQFELKLEQRGGK